MNFSSLSPRRYVYRRSRFGFGFVYRGFNQVGSHLSHFNTAENQNSRTSVGRFPCRTWYSNDSRPGTREHWWKYQQGLPLEWRCLSGSACRQRQELSTGRPGSGSSDQGRQMMKFQRSTGCRPAEACRLRRCDIDMGGPVWMYRPPQHRGSWHGNSQTIAIGPKAQELHLPGIRHQSAR
jgi:hypothetical protein